MLAARSHHDCNSAENPSAPVQPRSRRISATSAPVKRLTKASRFCRLEVMGEEVYSRNSEFAAAYRISNDSDDTTSNSLQRGHHISRNSLTASDRINSFIRFGLQVNAIRRDAKRLRQCLAHLGKVWTQFRPFENDHRIDMLDRECLIVQQARRVFQKLHAVGAFPLRIGIRKMRADIPTSCRAKKCLAKRRRQNTADRMPRRAFIKRHFKPADN